MSSATLREGTFNVNRKSIGLCHQTAVNGIPSEAGSTRQKIGTKKGRKFSGKYFRTARSAHLPDLADVCKLPPRQLVIGFPIRVFRARPII